MKVRQVMPENVRQKVAQYIKNKADISDLIEPYSLKNEDLTMAIITKLNRTQEDLSNCNFKQAIIGKEGETINLYGCDLRGCNFSLVRFLGTVWFRCSDLRNASLSGAWIPFCDYQYADLRNVNFCDVFMRLGSKIAYQAKVDKKFMEKFIDYLDFQIV